MKTLLIPFLAFGLSAYGQNAPVKPQKKPATPSVQCKGTTKKGERCKRKTSNISGYCYQHDKQLKK